MVPRELTVSRVQHARSTPTRERECMCIPPFAPPSPPSPLCQVVLKLIMERGYTRSAHGHVGRGSTHRSFYRVCSLNGNASFIDENRARVFFPPRFFSPRKATRSVLGSIYASLLPLPLLKSQKIIKNSLATGDNNNV